MTDPWHKGSRFYRAGQWAVLGAFVLAAYALIQRPEAAATALGVYGTVVTVWLAGGGVANWQERRNGGAP